MRTKLSSPQPNVGGNEYQQNGGLLKTCAHENFNWTDVKFLIELMWNFQLGKYISIIYTDTHQQNNKEDGSTYSQISWNLYTCPQLLSFKLSALACWLLTFKLSFQEIILFSKSCICLFKFLLSHLNRLKSMIHSFHQDDLPFLKGVQWSYGQQQNIQTTYSLTSTRQLTAREV